MLRPSGCAALSDTRSPGFDPESQLSPAPSASRVALGRVIRISGRYSRAAQCDLQHSGHVAVSPPMTPRHRRNPRRTSLHLGC